MDWDLIKKVGILPADIAALMGVTRVAASRWVNGHCQPHPLLTVRAAAVNVAIQKAVDAGDLPLRDKLKPREQRASIKKTIERYLA